MDSDGHDHKAIETFLPLLPLRDVAVFPCMMIPLFVGRDKSIAALNASMAGGRKIFVVAQKNAQNDEPEINDLYSVGTIASILQLLKLPDGTVKVLIEGECRASVKEVCFKERYLQAKVNILENDVPGDNTKITALSRSLESRFQQYAQISKKVPSDVLTALSETKDPGRIADMIASHIAMRIEDKQKAIEIIDLAERQEFILGALETEIDLHEVEKQVRGRVKKQMERSQREYYLTEQMKAIQKELGTESEHDELACLKKRIDDTPMPKEAREKVNAEFRKLKQMSPMSAEATVVRSYIDWMICVPWQKKSRLRNDLQAAEKLLDGEHYGLEEVKSRVLEYLAVQQRTKKIRGPVLCLVGPPGVGKTSLGESIAKAVNRQFIRVALGGVRDEAEIRGHRRTYIGSMPGRIIQKLAKTGVRNPLVLLDEVDKIGSDMRGDPASALLEVLDPEQNCHFNDHYLEVDYDLSDIMFICTSNSMDIPAPLLDRMEIIRLPGYTEAEKVNIATQYLIKNQLKLNGIRKGELSFTDAAILQLIRFYTKEAGVRGLEREISKICRKHVRKTASDDKKMDAGKNDREVTVTADSVVEYNGVQKYTYGVAGEKDQVGIVTGLAWTSVGGELLNVEVVAMPGKGKILKTGSLGDVMQESIQAALTVVRSRASTLGIPENFNETIDLHIHVPEGATPKDGPSAGITMCTAIASALANTPARADIAMTGEINLRGQVLLIGGLKEKLLAAHRGGIKGVIIPHDNIKDLQEIPEEIRNDLEIHPVKWIEEVLDLVLISATPVVKKCKEVVVVETNISSKEERVNTH